MPKAKWIIMRVSASGSWEQDRNMTHSDPDTFKVVDDNGTTNDFSKENAVYKSSTLQKQIQFFHGDPKNNSFYPGKLMDLSGGIEKSFLVFEDGRLYGGNSNPAGTFTFYGSDQILLSGGQGNMQWSGGTITLPLKSGGTKDLAPSINGDTFTASWEDNTYDYSLSGKRVQKFDGTFDVICGHVRRTKKKGNVDWDDTTDPFIAVSPPMGVGLSYT